MCYRRAQILSIAVFTLLIISCKNKETKQIIYEPSLESIGQHECPEWFRDAKFGILMHGGVMSVVEGNSGWYGRHMYMENNYEWGRDYERHL